MCCARWPTRTDAASVPANRSPPRATTPRVAPVWAGIGAYQLASQRQTLPHHRRRQPARRRRHHPVLVRLARRAAEQRRLGQRSRPRRIRHRVLLSALGGCVALRGRLRGHRRLPARHHRVRVVVRALPEDHPRLLPDRSQRAVVGDLLHDRRHRNQHADLHRHPGAGLRREHDVPAARGRLHHRPRPRQRPVHPGVFPRRSVHVVRAAAAPLRHARQDAVGGDLPHHALAGRRHPAVHHRAGDLDRHAGAGQPGW